MPLPYSRPHERDTRPPPTLLVFRATLRERVHFNIEMMWWTGLAPLEFGFAFPGSLISTFGGGVSGGSDTGCWQVPLTPAHPVGPAGLQVVPETDRSSSPPVSRVAGPGVRTQRQSRLIYCLLYFSSSLRSGARPFVAACYRPGSHRRPGGAEPAPISIDFASSLLSLQVLEGT